MSLKEQFFNTVKYLSPVRFIEDEPEPPDPEADLANNIGPWAMASECEELFIPWLEERIESLDIQEADMVRSHPDMLVAKGRRLEAKRLRDQFLQWRGTSRKAPA